MSDVVTVTDQLPPVAKSIFVECKKCGQDRYHRVLAHKSEKSAQLECEVCHKKRTYTLKAPKKKTVGKAKKSGGEGLSRTQHSALWQEMHAKFQDQSPADYNMRGVFEKDSKLTHPKFGVGFVMSSSGNKIEVVFEDMVRSLVQKMN